MITGTSSGIGTVIAYELAKRGAQVIAGNRNVDKAHKAMEKIQDLSDDLSGLTILPLDISSIQSVREFAAKINWDTNNFFSKVFAHRPDTCLTGKSEAKT